MSILQLEGAYENELAATGDFNPQAPKTALLLPSGQRVVLPTDVLLQALAGQPVSNAGASNASASNASTGNAMPQDAQESRTGGGFETGSTQRTATAGETVIPLIAEQMLVGKTEVETGRVRLRRDTQEEVQTVSVPLSNVTWEIEHVPVDQAVETQPEIRQVGETIIFPLVEERLVVKRELWLREEVHVRKTTSVIEKSADFTVKRDVLIEDRTGTEGR